MQESFKNLEVFLFAQRSCFQLFKTADRSKSAADHKKDDKFASAIIDMAESVTGGCPCSTMISS